MKNKGTKISASSLLTIIGVVCFASVIVSALVLSSTLTVVRTPTDYPISIAAPAAYTGGTPDYAALPGSDPIIANDYDFSVSVTAGSATDATLTVAVSGGTLSTLEYNVDNGAWIPLATTGGTIPTDSYSSTAVVIGFHVVYSSTSATTISITANS